MACTKPLRGWRIEGGKLSSLRPRRLLNKAPEWMVEVPCGQCMDCRLEKSRTWAVRIMHEAQMHERNSFLTLTYDEEHLPEDGSLKVEDFQDFMKRLRHWHRKDQVLRGVAKEDLEVLRFYHCGEYGDENGRPHYHACLFGEDFWSTRKFYKMSKTERLYQAAPLSSAWGNGLAVIGDLSFESAAYVARYVCKKVTGRKAVEHYGGRKPDYATMSRKPGIGRSWIEKYGKEVYRSDSVIVNGHECKPPRYYDEIWGLGHEEQMEDVKAARVARAEENELDNGLDRLAVKDEVTKAKLNLKKRIL